MQFTAIFDCVIAIFAPLPPKFSRLRRAFGGRCAPGPAAPDPPLREHPRHLDSGGRSLGELVADVGGGFGDAAA